MIEINQAGLYLQAVKDGRGEVTPHSGVFPLKIIVCVYVRVRVYNIWEGEHLRLPTAFKVDLTFFAASRDCEK